MRYFGRAATSQEVDLQLSGLIPQALFRLVVYTVASLIYPAPLPLTN